MNDGLYKVHSNGKLLPRPIQVRIELDPPFKPGEESRRIAADPLSRIIHGREKWDRHLACLSWMTGWKPIPRVDE
jgi:hypothetical protein